MIRIEYLARVPHLTPAAAGWLDRELLGPAELSGDPLLARVDDNPWQKLKIRQLLSAALAEVGEQLEA